MPPTAAPNAETLTLNRALDEAVAKLPFFRRKAVQWKLRNPDFREGVLAELAAELSEAPEMEDMNVSAFAAAGPPTGARSFADVPIGIDPAKLAAFLDLILKYLPAIIDLITKLFPK